MHADIHTITVYGLQSVAQSQTEYKTQIYKNKFYSSYAKGIMESRDQIFSRGLLQSSRITATHINLEI